MENFKKNNEDLNQNNQIDKKILIEELSIDISDKFSINNEKTKLLIKRNLESLKNNINSADLLKNLKNDVAESFKEVSDENKEELLTILKGALELIENSSKIEIKNLKKDLENSIDINEFEKPINKYLPKKLIEKAKNPEKPHEHILGFALGTTNSAMTTTKFLYDLGAGIIKTPYHLYKIVKGDAKTNSFDNL